MGRKEEVKANEAPMTLQAVLHELAGLAKIFQVFSTGESVVMALIDAQGKTEALNKANVTLGDEISSLRETLAELRAEKKAVDEAMAKERDEALEETSRQIEAKKAGHQKELSELEGKILIARESLVQAEAEFSQVCNEQKNQWAMINAQVEEAGERLREANGALAALKEKL